MNNENYTVLARRFRPQTFSEVVGQDRIAQTLRNAILEGRVAHAYLFTGARGVGKTSMARIFAKALNCPNAVDAVPCNECEICTAVSAGQDVDVSEIDGASNRGIDDIRSLRANVNVKSMRTKYKVYIIDEVHMLTKEAFNALLKTLEEPPAGVKFIFCTTEPNKLPDTILSRCQRFDFGTVDVESIGERLRQIASTEGFTVDDEAIELVSRRANGSMRDSQSLFDQVLAFGSQHVTAVDVHRLLGTAGDDRIIGLVQAMIDRDQGHSLELLDAALADGVQLDALTDQLVSYLRDIMLAACGARGISLLGVSESARPTVEAQAAAWGLKTASAALQILAEAKIKMARATWGRAITELAIVRITLLEDLSRLDDLILRFQGKSTGTGNSGNPSRVSTDRPVNSSSRSLPAISAPPPPIAMERPQNDQAPPLPAIAVELVEVQKVLEPDSDIPAPTAAEDTSPATHAALIPPREETVTESVENPQNPVSVEVPFIDGNEQALLELLRTRNTDLTGMRLQRAAKCAILGPTRLEIHIPENYAFERQGLDQPPIISRLERQLLDATGVVVKVKFVSVPALQEVRSHSETTNSAIETEPRAVGAIVPAIGMIEAPKYTKKSEINSAGTMAVPTGSVFKPATRTVEDPQDEFVKAVSGAFGIDAWRVQERERITLMDGDDSLPGPDESETAADD